MHSPTRYPETVCNPPYSTGNRGGKRNAAALNQLITASQELLENHPINIKRRDEGKDPANSIWPWSPGYRPSMQPLSKMFPVKSGAVISAVDLIRGIGVYAGLEVIMVEGATGLYDTTYDGKADAAIVEKERLRLPAHRSSDEAGHEETCH